jgi:UDP-N-acetylmuramoylalanine--D-glutamate ligase
VDTINKVRYFNDSKATNISAVAGALRSFKKPPVLILGGQNKGGDFGKLKKLIRTHTKKLIIMGEASPEIESILGSVCPGGFKLAASMEDAVFLAHRDASVDDVILLSPGCASFDMYSNYAHRGEAYCQAVDYFKNKFLANGKNQNRT